MCARRFAVAVVAAFLAVIAVISAAGCKPPPSLEVIGVDSGKVRGALVNDVWTYFGIPYAAAPVGRSTLAGTTAGGAVGWDSGCHQIRAGLSAAKISVIRCWADQ